MRVALIILLVGALMFSLRFSKSTADYTIENTSQIGKATNVELSIDRKVIYNGILEDIPSKFRARLSKGNHYVVVRVDNNGGLVQIQKFKVKGKIQIVVTHKAEYQVDLITHKPLPDGAVSRQIRLSVGDWDNTTNAVYVEIPDVVYVEIPASSNRQ